MKNDICSDKRRFPETDDDSVTYSDTPRLTKLHAVGDGNGELRRVDELLASIVEKKHPFCITMYDKDAFSFPKLTVEQRLHHRGHARALIYGAYGSHDRSWVNEMNIHINYGNGMKFPDVSSNVVYILGDGESMSLISHENNCTPILPYSKLNRNLLEEFFGHHHDLTAFRIVGTYKPQGTMTKAGMRWSGVFFHPYVPKLEP